MEGSDAKTHEKGSHPLYGLAQVAIESADCHRCHLSDGNNPERHIEHANANVFATAITV